VPDRSRTRKANNSGGKPGQIAQQPKQSKLNVFEDSIDSAWRRKSLNEKNGIALMTFGTYY
jgi:hypothetical protein